ncbi:hypothetical protein [Nocardia rhizosphaerae]|uniref:DUF222 domain-containing protein n=1 Tax=Nocardia rhizosphaerae TaxID=1691571 RepID=A0ABV8KY89_9NOCA
MSTDATSDDRGHHPDGFAEFTEELRLLAEVLLARVEPVLRRTAADGRSDLGGCSWCPVCAAAALIRGEHHDVVAALAEHGTSMVTVLREALAGVPVEPVLPPEWAEYAAAHHHSWFGGDPADDAARAPGATDAHDPATEHHAPGTRATTSAHGPAGAHEPTTTHHPAGTHGTAGTRRQAGAHNPAGVDDPANPHYPTGARSAAGAPSSVDTSASTSAAGTPGAPGSSSTHGPTDAHGSANADGPAEGRVHAGADAKSGRSGSADPASTGTADPADTGRATGRRGARWGSVRRENAPRPRRVDEFTSTHTPGTDTRPDIGLVPPPPTDAEANTDGSRSTRAPRSRYVDIPVTIRG